MTGMKSFQAISDKAMGKSRSLESHLMKSQAKPEAGKEDRTGVEQCPARGQPNGMKKKTEGRLR